MASADPPATTGPTSQTAQTAQTAQIDRKVPSAPDRKQTAPTHIPTSAFTPVNDLPLEIKEPIKITTSKKWVLPPRPKPGRKPVSSSDLDTAAFSLDKDSSKSKICKPDIHHNHSHNHNHLRQVTIEKRPFSFPPERDNSISTAVPSGNTTLASSPADFSCLSPKSSSSCMPTPSPTPDSLSPKLESNVPVAKPPQTQLQPPAHTQPEKRKRSVAKLAHHAAAGSKRKQDQPVVTNSNKMIEVDCSIIHNPLKTEILKINEENYYLKLEVIRLVSNLKGLRDEIQPIVDKRKTKAGRKVKKEKSTAAAKPAASPALPTAAPTTVAQGVQKQNPNTFTPVLPQASSSTAPAATPVTAPTKKRNHDDDINDLILSLIDLSHSQQTSESKPASDEAAPNSDSARNTNASTTLTMTPTTTTETNTHTHTHTDTNKYTNTNADMKRSPETKGTNNKATKMKPKTKLKAKPKPKPSNADLQADAAPIPDAVDFATMNAPSSSTTTAAAATVTAAPPATSTALSPLVLDQSADALRQGQHSHVQSPVFSNDLVNDPFFELSSKALLDRQTLYDEDDLDLLSTVSTTPSTMFSLSLSATNETVDSVAGSSGPMLMGGLENIDELPPFNLLNLPDEKAIAAGKLDIRLNYDYDRSVAENRYPPLDTFSLLDGGISGDRDRDIGSLQLLSDRRLSVDGSSGPNTSELVDFAMPEDVESVFDTFIHGRGAF